MAIKGDNMDSLDLKSHFLKLKKEQEETHKTQLDPKLLWDNVGSLTSGIVFEEEENAA